MLYNGMVVGRLVNIEFFKDVEGRFCGLILGTVLAFVRNDWGKPWKDHDDCVFIGWDLNQASECKSEVLPHGPIYSVSVYCHCDMLPTHSGGATSISYSGLVYVIQATDECEVWFHTWVWFARLMTHSSNLSVTSLLLR